MTLLRLVYFSENRLGGDDVARQQQMDGILAASIANNRRAGITGAMIHDSRWIVQVLEGRPQDVMSACLRIRDDPRHRDMVVADTIDTEERRFPYWWMASAAIEPDMVDLVRRHSERDTLDPRGMSGRDLIALTEAVVSAYTDRTTPRPSLRAEADAEADA